MRIREATLVATAAAAVAVYIVLRRRRRSIPASIPHAHVISLARLPAARSACLKRAAEAGVEAVEVFDAVDGRDLSTDYLERRGVRTYSEWRIPGSTFRFFDRELKWGEVGCALSHVDVWKLVAALPLPPPSGLLSFSPPAEEPVALVLEDDVDFVPRFAELLRTALDEVRWLVASGRIAPPDAMYLGRKAMRPELDELLPRSGESTGVRIITPGFSYKTTAYLLWRRGAIKLLSSGYEGKLIPVDDFLALTYAKHEAQVGVARPDLDELFADAPRINMLAVRPSLCRERRGISATENSPLLSEDPKAPRAKTK